MGVRGWVGGRLCGAKCARLVAGTVVWRRTGAPAVQCRTGAQGGRVQVPALLFLTGDSRMMESGAR